MKIGGLIDLFKLDIERIVTFDETERVKELSMRHAHVSEIFNTMLLE